MALDNGNHNSVIRLPFIKTVVGCPGIVLVFFIAHLNRLSCYLHPHMGKVFVARCTGPFLYCLSVKTHLELFPDVHS